MIPSGVFAPVLRAQIARYPNELIGCQAVAHGAKCDPAVVWRAAHESTPTIDFDLADRMLCALDVEYLWYEEPLREIYYGTDVSRQRCACPGCNVYFTPCTSGGTTKRFCSRTCATVGRRIERGLQNRRVKHDSGRQHVKGYRSDRCRNGHKRTEENTTVLSSGKIRCRVCQAKTSREGYHRRKLVMA